MRPAFEGLIWFGALGVAALVLAIVLLRWRRRLRAESEGPLGGFSLDQLRRLRGRGELSPAEFETLRRSAIDQVASPRSDSEGAKDKRS